METVMNTPATTNAVYAKMGIDAWHQQNDRVTKLVNSLTDEQMEAEAAPGRNTGTYLLGHLTAVSDRMIEAMGWGQRAHPELDAPFLLNPDKSEHARPSLTDLRGQWTEVNSRINRHIAAMQPADWFTRHMSVSEEDFAKEPHRNRLNLLLSRTIHTSGHLGQMLYLAEKK